MFSLLMTVLGTAATLFFGVLSVYLYRQSQYPGRIIFVKEICIGLFESIAQNVSNLEILYRKNPVGEHLNLALLLGILVNTGTKDITPTMVEKKLVLTLPSGFRWLEADILSSSSEKSSMSVLNDSEIEFDFGLFRRREYIRFKALAEVPDQLQTLGGDAGQALEAALRFKHRIADTRDEVNLEEVLSPSKLAGLSRTFFGLRITLIMFILFNIGMYYTEKNKPEIHYLLTTENSDVIEVEITPTINDTLEIKGVGKDFNKILTVEEFFNDHKWKPRIIQKGSKYLKLGSWTYVFVIPVLLVIAGHIFVMLERKKAKRARNLIGLKYWGIFF